MLKNPKKAPAPGITDRPGKAQQDLPRNLYIPPTPTNDCPLSTQRTARLTPTAGRSSRSDGMHATMKRGERPVFTQTHTKNQSRKGKKHRLCTGFGRRATE